MDYKGDIVVPLNEDEIRKAVKELFAEGVEAIAVSFLWSFRNPNHENRVKQIIHDVASNLYVVLSHEVCPRIREYPRNVTTVMSAQVGPALRDYLLPLGSSLKSRGLKGPLLVMHGSGGTMSVEEAHRYPIATIGSVLSGGVVGALCMGEQLGHKNIIATDVGGTTFLVGLIAERKPVFTNTHVINQFRINLPMVRVHSIGSGGGAIAWLDETQKLHVGPRSAGALPGPACYDEGGNEPTVTDADLVLGILNPRYFLGGRKLLNTDSARRALSEKIGKHLGMSTEEAAMAVFTIQNAQTADLLHKAVVQQGYDPRDFMLYAFGGAGPVHACFYGKEIGVSEVFVPLGPTAGAFSAFGLAASDVILTGELSDPANFPAKAEAINKNFERLEREVRARIDAQGIPFSSVSLRREVDVRYTLQIYEIPIPVKNGRLNEEDVAKIVQDFEEKYEQLYGKGTGYAAAGTQFITYRVFITGALRAKPSFREVPQANGKPVSMALKGQRRVFLDPKHGWQQTPIYDYSKLACGHEIEGPAVIEAPTTTVVVSAEAKGAHVDKFGNIIIRWNNSKS
jgi:N-methylhydantoinase A